RCTDPKRRGQPPDGRSRSSGAPRLLAPGARRRHAVLGGRRSGAAGAAAPRWTPAGRPLRSLPGSHGTRLPIHRGTPRPLGSAVADPRRLRASTNVTSFRARWCLGILVAGYVAMAAVAGAPNSPLTVLLPTGAGPPSWSTDLAG